MQIALFRLFPYKLFLKEKVAIICDTKEKGKALVAFIIEFIEKDRQITDSEMEAYKEKTCITYKHTSGWSYADIDYTMSKNVPLFEFDDVIELEEE
jgi:hypothetical protein